MCVRSLTDPPGSPRQPGWPVVPRPSRYLLEEENGCDTASRGRRRRHRWGIDRGERGLVCPPPRLDRRRRGGRAGRRRVLLLACMPSKALLRPGEVLAAARRVPAATAAISGSVDVEKALASRDAFASNWDDTPQAGWLAGRHRRRDRSRPGTAAGERRVEVATPDGGRIALTARRPVVLATGSSAAIPPIDGLRDIAVLVKPLRRTRRSGRWRCRAVPVKRRSTKAGRGRGGTRAQPAARLRSWSSTAPRCRRPARRSSAS